MTSRTEYSTQTQKTSTLFSGQYLRNHWTLDIGVSGYIGIVWPKEHSPEVRSLPPGTPCIWRALTCWYLWRTLWILSVPQELNIGLLLSWLDFGMHPRDPLPGQLDHVSRWFPLVLELILSWYPKFTLCSMLFIQPFQKWSQFQYNATLQTQNSAQLLSFFPLVHTSNSTLIIQLPSLLCTAFPCF